MWGALSPFLLFPGSLWHHILLNSELVIGATTYFQNLHSVAGLKTLFHLVIILFVCLTLFIHSICTVCVSYVYKKLHEYVNNSNFVIFLLLPDFIVHSAQFCFQVCAKEHRSLWFHLLPYFPFPHPNVTNSYDDVCERYLNILVLYFHYEDIMPLLFFCMTL